MLYNFLVNFIRMGAGGFKYKSNSVPYIDCLHSFDPPGQMSAGMSCEIVVTFKPMVSALYTVIIRQI